MANKEKTIKDEIREILQAFVDGEKTDNISESEKLKEHYAELITDFMIGHGIVDNRRVSFSDVTKTYVWGHLFFVCGTIALEYGIEKGVEVAYQNILTYFREKIKSELGQVNEK